MENANKHLQDDDAQDDSFVLYQFISIYNLRNHIIVENESFFNFTFITR